jgi:hypothetical protein
MFASNSDEIVKEEFVILELKLLLEHTDGKFIKVKGHIGNHLFILLLYFLITSSWRINRVNVQRVFRQSNRHNFYKNYYTLK